MPITHLGRHHTLFFFQKSLRNLFWASFLRESGFSLVGIFTLIYIFRLGSGRLFFDWPSLTQTQVGLLTVVIYVLILRTSALLSVFPSARIASIVGLPISAVIGNMLAAGKFAVLAASIANPWLIFLAAALQGLQIVSFEPAYNTMFAHQASFSKVGRDVGAFTFILRLTHALLPAVAGTLILGFGFSVAFVGSMTLLLLSNIPLLFMRWHEVLPPPSLRAFFSWYGNQLDRRVFTAICGKYVADVVLELWPIYLILLFGQIEQVGLLISLALFISLITTYLSGWYIDHTKKNIPFVAGGVFIAIFWIGRIGITALSLVLSLEVAQKIVESFFNPSFDVTLYKIAKHLKTYEFYVYKEVALSLVSLFFWSALGVIFFVFGAVWDWLFIVAALGIITATILYTTKQYE